MEKRRELDLITDDDLKEYVQQVISYALGCILGRWDIRVALNPNLVSKLPDPFDTLPICPPGMLVGPDGLPALSNNIVSEEWLRARPDTITLPPKDTVRNPTSPDSEYPLEIIWDGILVDDPGHKYDIICRAQEVFEVIWGDRAEAIEQEGCDILDVKDLRTYLRKPGSGGFWLYHVKRYSKSRRKAPIYWLLQSSKKNYALWIYYHRLDKDIYYKVLENYVEPKIRLEEDRLQQIRHNMVGAEGSELKRLERELDKQENFILELHDFREKLKRVTELDLEPDIDDGVVLNIAPLWELVPWNEAKKYWDELVAGKYEWSTMSKQLKERGVI